MEPSGRPDKSVWRKLLISFMFTPSFQRLKYEYITIVTIIFNFYNDAVVWQRSFAATY